MPNVHAGESGSLFADPDIDTMPLLAWSVFLKWAGSLVNKQSWKGAATSLVAVGCCQHTSPPAILFCFRFWAPFRSRSDKMAALGAKSKNARFMIGIQKWSYLPLLCVARFSWLQQGIQFAFGLEGDLMYENSTKSAELAKVSGD